MEWLRTGGETLVALAAMLLIAEQAPVTVIRSMVLASGQAATWSGRFGYEFSDGENVAGTAVVVTYELTVTPTSCQLSAEGYQTEETILCTVRTVANGIEVSSGAMAMEPSPTNMATMSIRWAIRCLRWRGEGASC